MGDAFLIVAGLTCVAGVVLLIMRIGRMRNGRDDDDAFGPRQ